MQHNIYDVQSNSMLSVLQSVWLMLLLSDLWEPGARFSANSKLINLTWNPKFQILIFKEKIKGEDQGEDPGWRSRWRSKGKIKVKLKGEDQGCNSHLRAGFPVLFGLLHRPHKVTEEEKINTLLPELGFAMFDENSVEMWLWHWHFRLSSHSVPIHLTRHINNLWDLLDLFGPCGTYTLYRHVEPFGQITKWLKGSKVSNQNMGLSVR